jgi:hypothetical protein
MKFINYKVKGQLRSYDSDWYYQSIGDKYLTLTNRFLSIIFLCYSDNEWYGYLNI